MKKKVLLPVLVMTLVTVIAGGVLVEKVRGNRQDEVEKAKVGLELLYEWQNQAFEISPDYDHNLKYCNADELKLNRVAVNLCAYNCSQPARQLTIDEVVDYFSEEYDSYGELKVYSKPENIHDYIDWYYHGGSDCIKDFGAGFNVYLQASGSSEYSDLSYEETSAALKGYMTDRESEQ